jgi:hypothetical protein
VSGDVLVGQAVVDTMSESLARPYTSAPVDVAAALGFKPDCGLAAKEAALRLERFGSNELRPRRLPSFAELILRQLRSLLIAILLVTAAIGPKIGRQCAGAWDNTLSSPLLQSTLPPDDADRP